MNAPAKPLAGSRVAILVQNLPVPFDRRVWQEATTLARAGAAVTVVCPDDDRHPAGTFALEGVSVVRYRNPREASGPLGYLNEYVTSLLRMTRALRRARGSRPFDIVHFCNPPDLLFLAAGREKRRYGATAVFDQHDLGPELVDAKSMPFKRIFRRVAQQMEKMTYGFSDYVVATNESYKAVAIERGGFSERNVTVVRSGPPRDWGTYEPDGVDYRNGRRHHIGYLGVMGEQEGIDYLLRAIRILTDDGFDVQLSLIGSGPHRPQLESLTRKLEISDRVRFHGRIPDEQLKSVLASTDVCTNPDEVNPMNDLSTMNKIIEYMALGRPIVQFDVREGRFSAGDASLYAKGNDAVAFAAEIATILKDPELAARMSEAGRRRFNEELSWEVQGSKLVSLYADIMERRKLPQGS